MDGAKTSVKSRTATWNSGPEARARVHLTLGTLEHVLGCADIVMRDRIDNGARPDL